MWDVRCTPYVPLTEATRLTSTDDKTASQLLIFHVPIYTTQTARSTKVQRRNARTTTYNSARLSMYTSQEAWNMTHPDSEIEELLMLIYV